MDIATLGRASDRSDEAIHLLYAESHDSELEAELLRRHESFVLQLAMRFSRRGEPVGDLCRVARLALMRALRNFDPGRGTRFPVYAVPIVVGELKRHFREEGWAVRAPMRRQDLYLRLNRVVRTLEQELGRSPTIPELATELAVCEEDLLEALEAGRTYGFVSRPVQVPLEDAGNAESGACDNDPEGALAPLLDTLHPLDRLVVRMRLLQGMTQSEIAARLGVSQMQVSRLLARSIAQLRAV
jgi:RNA polymerase sigma-B factor